MPVHASSAVTKRDTAPRAHGGVDGDTVPKRQSARDVIIGVTIELLEGGGYGRLRVDDVAKHARVSLTTLYKEFPSRDALVLGAIAHWMATQVYRPLAAPAPGEPWYASLAQMFRDIFDPLVRRPDMLAIYVRARSLPGGHRLHEQGATQVQPQLRAAFAGDDPEFATEVITVMEDVIYAVLGRFGSGTLPVDGIIPRIERAIALLAGVPLASWSRRGVAR